MSERAKIMTMRKAGKTRTEIADALGLTPRQVDKVVAGVLDEVRDGAALLVEETFHLQYERLESLYAAVQKRVDEMGEVFNADVFRVCLQVLDQQARLMGFSKNSGGNQRGRKPQEDRWIDEASDSELIHEAESLGIKVPEKFKLA